MVVRRTLVLAAAIAAAASVSALAGQGPEKISADLSIRVDPNPRGTVPYVGKLRSEKRACENLRTVTLWRINEGDTVKQNQGTSVTNGAGKWAIDSLVNPDGEYFATTPAYKLSNGKLCKKARSKSIFRDLMD